MTLKDITIRDMVKNILSQLESLDLKEQYSLNSISIISDLGKIPIEQPIQIYIDLDLLIDLQLGQILKNIYKSDNQQRQLQQLKSFLVQLKEKPYYTLEDFKDVKIDNDINEIIYYSPFKSTIFYLNNLISNIEPIWQSDSTYNLDKYLTICINQYPYIFSDILKEYLKIIISSVIKVNNISFINIPYTQLQPKTYKILYVYNLKDFLQCSHILHMMQQYNEKFLKFGLDDIILFANRKNIISKKLFEQKYNNNLELADKELRLLGSYMNIFLTFDYVDEFPLLMDDFIKQEVTING